MDLSPNRKRSSPARRRRNQRRAEEWRRKKAGRSPNNPSGSVVSLRRIPRLQWVRGPILTFNPPKEEPLKPNVKTKTAKDTDPERIYKDLEINMKLARLEEPTTLTLALRHLIRQLHPSGRNITFPVPDTVDRIQLRCANLPTATGDLRVLVEQVFSRRQEVLNFDDLYRDFVMSYGRVTSDLTKPWPLCYAHTRHP